MRIDAYFYLSPSVYIPYIVCVYIHTYTFYAIVNRSITGSAILGKMTSHFLFIKLCPNTSRKLIRFHHVYNCVFTSNKMHTRKLLQLPYILLYYPVFLVLKNRESNSSFKYDSCIFTLK